MNVCTYNNYSITKIGKYKLQVVALYLWANGLKPYSFCSSPSRIFV